MKCGSRKMIELRLLSDFINRNNIETETTKMGQWPPVKLQKSGAFIEELQITWQSFDVLPANLFRHFDMLKRLEFNGNQIQIIETGAFDHCMKLESLAIWNQI